MRVQVARRPKTAFEALQLTGLASVLLWQHVVSSTS